MDIDASCSTSEASKTIKNVVINNHAELLDIRVQPPNTVICIYFSDYVQKRGLVSRLTYDAREFGKNFGFEVIILPKDPTILDQDEGCDSSDEIVDYSTYQSKI